VRIAAAHGKAFIHISAVGIDKRFGDAVVDLTGIAGNQALIGAVEINALTRRDPLDEFIADHPAGHPHRTVDDHDIIGRAGKI